MSEQKIEPIHTCCKNCVYANYDNITQIGCYLKYIDYFKSKNLDIVEAYDEDKEFYIINNKYCIGYKTQDWFNNRNLNELSLEEKIKKHIDNNYIKYTVWIDLYNFANQESLNNLTQELSKLKIQPANIIFVRYKNLYKDLHHFDNIKKILVESNMTHVKWRIETMLSIDDDIKDKIHNVVMNCKKRFVVIIDNPPLLLNEIIDKANNIISIQMDSISILSNENRSAIFFPVSNYKYSLYCQKEYLLDQQNLYQYI